MKTTEALWNELKQLAKKESDGGYPQLDNVNNILFDWGRELCEEQRYKCQYDYDKRTIGHDGDIYIHCEDVLNAPLPEILNNK